MIALDKKLSERFPGTKIEAGTVIGEFCRIDPGCEISAGAEVEPKVALCANVHIHGNVHIEIGCVIRENVTLVGPLQIKEHTFIGRGSIIGAAQEGEIINHPTLVGAQVRIGKEVEIIAGVKIGDGARIRARSKVIGDVPRNGLVSRSPAILEGYICPNCGKELTIREANPPLLYVGCPCCHQPPIIMKRSEWGEKPNHVLLPDNQLGEFVSTLGDDPRWLDEWETR